MDWASSAFGDGERRGSGELSKDNSSSVGRSMLLGTTSSLPLSGRDGGSGRGGPRDFLAWQAFNRVRRRSLSSRNRFACSRKLCHQPGLLLLSCLHFLVLEEELVFKGKVCWVAGHDSEFRRSGGMFKNDKGFGVREITWEWVYPRSCVLPLRFLARRFPHTTPIVVSEILRVNESLGHSPITNRLQPAKQTRRRRWCYVVPVMAKLALFWETEH